MNIPSSYQDHIDTISADLKFIEKTVKETMGKFCERQGFLFKFRLKSIESIIEKIETGRFENWSMIDDLFACSIIIETLLQEDQVIAFCEKAFDVKTEDKKLRNRHPRPPDSFVFDTTRLICTLRVLEGDTLLTRNCLKFEIQVQTIFEHAWLVASHRLTYKSPDVSWKHLRLIAMLKASVEQIDSLILSFDNVNSTNLENEYIDIKIRSKIIKLISSSSSSGLLPIELQPLDLSRASDNILGFLMQFEKSSRKNERLDSVAQNLDASYTYFETYLKKMGLQIPMNLSFFQLFCISQFNARGMPSTQKLYLPISQEMMAACPSAKAYVNKFEK